MSEPGDKFDLYAAVGERRAEIVDYLQEWVARETAAEPLDKDACERAVSALYRLHSMKAPSMVWCNSVFELSAIALTWSSTGSLSFITENSHDGSKFATQWQELASSSLAQKLEKRLSVKRFTVVPERNRTFLGESRHFYSFFKLATNELYKRLSKESFPSEMLGGLALIAHEFNKLRAFIDDDTIIRQRHLIEISATRDVMLDLWPVIASQSKRVDSGLAVRIERTRVPSVDSDFCLWLSVWEIQKFLPYVVVLDLFSEAMQHIHDERTWEELTIWSNLARTGGWFLFFRDLCIVCQPPEKITTDDLGDLHNGSGSGIAFGDGYGQYYLRGRPVERHVIENPESITIAEIEQEDNVEIRRVLIERYGLSRFIFDSGAQKIHEDDSGTLYRKEFPGDEPVVVVMVKNATPEPDGSFKDYFLRVPPDVETAREAVAWTFRMLPDQYEPVRET